jgi:hypothetical protein
MPLGEGEVTKRTFFLVHATARANAARYVADEAPDGHMVTVSEPTKKRIQEEKYHAMMGDIARQTTYAGKRWVFEDMKRILIDEFADEMRNAGKPLHNDSRIIPSENGLRIIQLNIRSGDFWVKEAAEFIEFLYAWGTLRDVRWSEPKQLQPA